MKGLDASIWDAANTTPMPEPKPLTAEMIEKLAADLLKNHGRPQAEIHHPRCPAWLSRGLEACRCGTNPLEAALADDLARMARNGRGR